MTNRMKLSSPRKKSELDINNRKVRIQNNQLIHKYLQECFLMGTTTLVCSNVSTSMSWATNFAYLKNNSSMIPSPNSADKRGSKTALMVLVINSPLILLLSIKSSTSSWRFASQPILIVFNVSIVKRSFCFNHLSNFFSTMTIST